MNNLTGKRFGKLIVIDDSKERNKSGHIIWNCKCDCGKLTKVWSNHLKSGHTKSCGCIYEKLYGYLGCGEFKHGDSCFQKHRPRLYKIWTKMKERCYSKNAVEYKYYGLRGISIFSGWLYNYPTFKQWALANGYANNLTIDRIDNDKGYYPENCQWITRADNTRKANFSRKRKDW